MNRAPRIESDTPLRPRAVAEGVWEEASVWLDQPLPRRWLRELIAQANTVYAHNQRFRRRLCGNGDTGRHWLWLFTRHWLAALIHERRPHLYPRLPQSYSIGKPLPSKPAVTGGQRKPCDPSRPPLRSVRAPIAGHAWAAAAHFLVD